MASRDYGSLLQDVSGSVPSPKVQDGTLSESADSSSNTDLKVIMTNWIARLSLPHYHFKIFRGKAALLVLLWSFIYIYLIQFFITTKNPSIAKLGKISSIVVFTMCLLLYPVFGWIADVWCGRYKMIKWSMRLMWAFSILSCLFYTLAWYYELHAHSLSVIFYVCMSLTLGGFLANVLQFGVDQLIDASSSEITSFIRWHLWIWFFSSFAVGLTQSCVCSDYEMVGYLLLPTLLTLAVTSDFLFNHWLVKEPTSPNPFILIFRVLQYAVKHKYPRQRSAFTYWDDRRFSRIDLAKNKYGGPYTTEQVEDVKTFFRITCVVLNAALFISLCISVFPIFKKVTDHLHHKHYTPPDVCEYSYLKSSNCFQRVAVDNVGTFAIVVFLPLFEIILYPLLKRYFSVFILRKIGLGMILLLLSIVACAVIEVVAHLKLPVSHENLTCPLYYSEVVPNTLPLDYKWMLISYSLNSFGQFLLMEAGLEFICAQSPYSMKGLLLGFTYGSIGFFTILDYPLFLLIQFIVKKFLPEYYGCVFWYLVITVSILFVIIIVSFLALKCYKSRFRDENQHNEQIFAENYYSQCHDSVG